MSFLPPARRAASGAEPQFLCCILGLTALLWLPALQVKAADETPLAARTLVPAQAAPILPLKEVRQGMRGYGLTVFQGVAIEPFAVEVVSVMHDAEPAQGAIWIRCTDARMAHNGLVQGMSGSPIYLWADAEPQVLGQGGRLIGAFAFGYTNLKETLVGVQPIEQMRAIAQRAKEQKPRPLAVGSGTQALERLIAAAAGQGVDSPQLARTRLLAQALRGPALNGVEQPAPALTSLSAAPAAVHGLQALRLPVLVSVPTLEGVLAPWLEPLGLQPIAAPAGVTVGKPPAWLDMEKVRLAPGSAINVPLAWGDLDLSANGTVTDVLPDGQVLAFGHAFSGDGRAGEGAANLPIATGFVHTVMPRTDISFKVAGSGLRAGTLVREENAGIVAAPVLNYDTAKVVTEVHMPDQPVRSYRYQVVRHPQMTAVLSAVTALQSMTALQSPPVNSTLRLEARLSFDGDRVLHLDNLLPNAGAMDVLLALAPAMATLAENAHQSVLLRELRVKLSIEPELRVGILTQARLDRGELAPGEQLMLTLRVQRYGADVFEKRVPVVIPANTPEGDYQLTICDARTYLPLLVSQRPHLLSTSNVDDLFTLLERILTVPDDALMVLLQLRQEGLAIGARELADLPSSRRALLATSTSTAATVYPQWHEQMIPLGLVTRSNMNFNIQVRAEHEGGS